MSLQDGVVGKDKDNDCERFQSQENIMNEITSQQKCNHYLSTITAKLEQTQNPPPPSTPTSLLTQDINLIFCLNICFSAMFSNQQSSTGDIGRPRFVTTVPIGKYLAPNKEQPVVPPIKQRTYAFCSVPKLFAQRINKENEFPISGIQAVQPITSYGKSNKLR